MKPYEYLTVLKQVSHYDFPVGATFLSTELNLPQARIGRILLALEEKGYLTKISNKGRLITPKGMEYLSAQENRTDKLAAAQCIIETAESGSCQQLCEVLQIRLSLETLAARQACAAPSPQGLARLEEILGAQQQDLDAGGSGSEFDLAFHLTIAELSQNKTLAHILKLLLTEEDAYTKFSIAAPHRMGRQVQQHRRILQAIQARDGDAACQAVEEHLRQVLSDVQHYYQTSTPAAAPAAASDSFC